jgi:pilus assembly protein Flp/PilA
MEIIMSFYNTMSLILSLVLLGVSLYSLARPVFRYLSASLSTRFRKTPVLASAGENGQGLVEYALILVLIAVVAIAILVLFGETIGDVFLRVACDFEARGQEWTTCTYEDGIFTFEWPD